MGNFNTISRAQIEQLRKKVDLSVGEIKALHEEYKRSCRYGNQLTIREFQDIYKELFTGDSSSFAEHIFRAFDKNGNGKVDFEEFLLGVCVMSTNDVEKKLRWAFNIYDIDGNGSIDRNEMTAIIRVQWSLSFLPIFPFSPSFPSLFLLPPSFFPSFLPWNNVYMNNALAQGVYREYVYGVAVYQKYLTRLGELIIFEPWRENYYFSQPS